MATPNFKGMGRHNPAMCLEGEESETWVDSTHDDQSLYLLYTLTTRSCSRGTTRELWLILV